MRTVLALLCLLCLLAGCASDGSQDVNDVAASPLLLKEADKNAEDKEEIDGVCRHVWQAAGFHPYTNTSTGLPFTDLCTIQRCAKCGAERHECTRNNRPRRR